MGVEDFWGEIEFHLVRGSIFSPCFLRQFPGTYKPQQLELNSVAICFLKEVWRARVAVSVSGINPDSLPVTVREKFWLSEIQCYGALRWWTLVAGFQEAFVLATCNRTEFILSPMTPTTSAGAQSEA